MTLKPAALGVFSMMMICDQAADAEYARSRANLTEECEIALALSALPSRLRETASVFVNDDGTYTQRVRRDGPFTCIIERVHSASMAPQCMDRAGAASILPALIRKSELALSGSSSEEVEAAFAAAVAAGEILPAESSGVSYMMSDYNYIYVPAAEQVLKVPPHVMFYAPNVSNDDVGGSLVSATANIGTPFVFSEGVHGYFITYVEHAASSDAVTAACQGQLGEAPPRFQPFPQEQ